MNKVFTKNGWKPLQNKKHLISSAFRNIKLFIFALKNRSDVIRTRDLYVPNVALYQAEPHSDKISRTLKCTSIRRPCQGTTEKGFEPLLTESESAVLPLHHSAMFSSEQMLL